MQIITNQNIDRRVSLYLRLSDVDPYFIEGNENKYLVFALIENNKKVLQLYKKLSSKIDNKLDKN